MKYFPSIVLLAATIEIVTFASQASAAILSFTTNLSGPNESPVNTSTGTGQASVTIDNLLDTLGVQITFSGLVGTTTTAHIHSATAVPGVGTAGVATTTPVFAGFPLGVTSGSYNNTLDLRLASSYNPAFITANGGSIASAEAALINGIVSGRAYVNIHSTVFPGGEIRGFLAPVAVPEPAGALGYSLVTLGAIFILKRKLKSRPYRIEPID